MSSHSISESVATHEINEVCKEALQMRSICAIGEAGVVRYLDCVAFRKSLMRGQSSLPLSNARYDSTKFIPLVFLTLHLANVSFTSGVVVNSLAANV